MLVPHLYCVDPPWTVPHYTLKVQWAHSLVSGFELQIFQFISAGYSHVHVRCFHHFYMNQSVQFSFCKTVVLNWPTHIAIHRNKKTKKIKIKPQQYLTVSLPFFYLAWSGKDHWHRVRRSWERYSDFRWILI